MFSWILAFHIISLVCWFAGLFYLPRLMVYHVAISDQPTTNQQFKVMERRLYHGIMHPSALATILFGGWLLGMNFHYYLHQPWMIIKLFLVLLLLIYHCLCGYHVRQFRLDRNQKNALFFRYFNEIPTVLLISIVILAVVKPI